MLGDGEGVRAWLMAWWSSGRGNVVIWGREVYIMLETSRVWDVWGDSEVRGWCGGMGKWCG